MSEIIEPTPADLAIWSAVDSFDAFGAATADWLEGRRGYLPTYAEASPAEETSDLVEDLAAINRLGFATDGSQPGVPLDAERSGQRAYVTGYCDEHTAGLITSGLSTTELVVLHFAPEALGEGQVVVTLDQGQEFTWLGWADAAGAAGLYAERAGSSLAALVQSAWELHIFDPVWGRNDQLLPTIRRVLETRS
jgi:hypothetical protein